MNGVVTPVIKRVAAHHSPGSHCTTFYHTVFIDRLITVMRAGWIKAAGVWWQGPGNTRLVYTDESQQRDAGPIDYFAGKVTQMRFFSVIVRQVLKGHGFSKEDWRVSARLIVHLWRARNLRQGEGSGLSAADRILG